MAALAERPLVPRGTHSRKDENKHKHEHRGEHTARHSVFARIAHAAMPRTTPARLRAGVAATALLACCLAAVSVAFSAGLTTSFQAIGQRDAPEVNAATGLYFSLNDMDAQVANMLLAGEDAALAHDRSQDMASYEKDRATADADLQQAAVTAATNSAAQAELQSVLEGMGQFETLSAQALLTDQQDARAAGPAPAAAAGYYRQATDLMRTRILPAVSSLTTVSADELTGSYEAGRSTASSAIGVVITVGLALLAALVVFQVYLAVRFRRMVNPALAAATLLTLVMMIVTVTLLGSESEHLRVAKQDAFDSIIALTQARAVSYDANADESRYLVDPGRAAQYQQSFLAKSQLLANVGNVGIYQYDSALAQDVSAYQAGNSDVRFGGYLGAEFHNITFPGERAAAVRTMLAYQAYERDDRVLRSLAKTNMAAAVAYDTGTAPGQSDWAFNRYSAALSSLITINENAFTAAVTAGKDDGGPQAATLPAAGALLIAVLVLLGVRPRLAEYRH
jgi:hypothetical protein